MVVPLKSPGARQSMSNVVIIEGARAAARAFVQLNMAMTADGKIATASRRVSSFGSHNDQEKLYQLRSRADAILCGAGTLRAENAILDVGDQHARVKPRRGRRSGPPVRVAVSGSASLAPDAAIFRHGEGPVIVLTSHAAPIRRVERLAQVATEVWVGGETEVDLRSALARLRSEWGVERVVGEGGAQLNDALFRLDLVDELHLTICPFLFGGDEAPTIADGVGVALLEEATRFRLRSLTRKKDELFLVYEVIRQA